MSTLRIPVRLIAGALLLAGLFTAGPANALTNFARKYGYECSMCHTTIPRLNRFGYEFRAAGYRIPSEIGTTQKMTWDTALAARLSVSYANASNSTYKDFKPLAPGTTPIESHSSSSQLTGASASIYPMIGSFGKHYYTHVEIGLTNGNPVSVSQAHIGFVWGKEEQWFNFKVGLFSSKEGYGASDRGYSGTPLAGATTADNSGAVNSAGVATSRTTKTQVKSSVTGEGISLGWHYKNTSLEGMIFNGNSMSADGKTLVNATGGANTKVKGQLTENSKDYALFFNQILKKDGSGVSLTYYNGRITLPKNMIAPPGAQTQQNSFADNYYRVGLYANWMFMPKFGTQAGYIYGEDHSYNPLTLTTSDTFKNDGWFVEAYSPVLEKLTVGVRYDAFDPSKIVAHNNVTKYTLYATAPFQDGMSLSGSFAHTSTQRYNCQVQWTGAGGNAAVCPVWATPLPDTKDDSVNFGISWVF